MSTSAAVTTCGRKIPALAGFQHTVLLVSQQWYVPELADPPFHPMLISKIRKSNWYSRNGGRGLCINVNCGDLHLFSSLARQILEKQVLFLNEKGLVDLCRLAVKAYWAGLRVGARAPLSKLPPAEATQAILADNAHRQALKMASFTNCSSVEATATAAASSNSTGTISAANPALVVLPQLMPSPTFSRLLVQISDALSAFNNEEHIHAAHMRAGDVWHVTDGEPMCGESVTPAIFVAAANLADIKQPYRGVRITLLEMSRQARVELTWYKQEMVEFPDQLRHVILAVADVDQSQVTSTINHLIVPVDDTTRVVIAAARVLSMSTICQGQSPTPSAPSGVDHLKPIGSTWKSRTGQIVARTEAAVPGMSVFAADGMGNTFGCTVRSVSCCRWIVSSGSSSQACKACGSTAETVRQHIHRYNVSTKQHANQLLAEFMKGCGDDWKPKTPEQAAQLHAEIAQIARVSRTARF
jgi:DNA-binding CsgD family transcriptional regulator